MVIVKAERDQPTNKTALTQNRLEEIGIAMGRIAEVSTHVVQLRPPSKARLIVPHLENKVREFIDILSLFKNPKHPQLAATLRVIRLLPKAKAIESEREPKRKIISNNAFSTAKRNINFSLTHSSLNREDLQGAQVLADNAAADLAKYVSWEVVRDLPKLILKPNPLAALLEVYGLGVLSLGFSTVDGQEKFVAHVPLSYPDGDNVLGCWVQGDKSLTYIHRFSEHCQSNVSLFPAVPPRNMEPHG